jgi:hypothetical protein
MVNVMPQELDPELSALFAAANQPRAEAEFHAAVLRKIAAEQRSRLIRHCVLAAVALIALLYAMPAILSATALAIGRLNELPAPDASVLVSPSGWAVSMALGLAVLLRFTPLLRRR